MSRLYSDIFLGEFYAPTTIPVDCIPCPFKEELPATQFHHTDAQLKWRRQIIRKLMKQRDDMRIAYCMGWSYGIKSPYAKQWQSYDEMWEMKQRNLRWKPEIVPLEQRTEEKERKAVERRERKTAKVLDKAADKGIYITGTSGVIMAAQSGACAALVEAPWGKWGVSGASGVTAAAQVEQVE